MTGFSSLRALIHVPTIFLIGGLVFFMAEKSHADSLEILGSKLPDRVMGWRAEPKDHFFDRETIFDYINGAGEVYRAYNFQRCLSRRYLMTGGPAIVLDIFDMRSSEDAFGVFTHDQDGDSLDVGQGALYRPGWLSFWKDRFFVSIYSEEETALAEKAVRMLGKTVASHILSEGPKPRILSELPAEGLQPKTVRYLHHPDILNYHFYISDENILNLAPGTEAALGEYRRKEAYARFLLVRYPGGEKAEKAFASLLRHYLPDADSKGVVRLENGKWSAAALEGPLLAVVLEADSRAFAESLIEKAMADN